MLNVRAEAGQKYPWKKWDDRMDMEWEQEGLSVREMGCWVGRRLEIRAGNTGYVFGKSGGRRQTLSRVGGGGRALPMLSLHLQGEKWVWVYTEGLSIGAGTEGAHL